MSSIHNIITKNYSVSGTIIGTGGSVAIALEGRSSAAAVITGVWNATLNIEASCDGGITWTQVWFSNVNPSAVALGIPTPTLSTTVNGTYSPFSASGVTHYRVKASVLSSGTVAVVLTTTSATPSFMYGSVATVQQVVADPNNSSTTNLPGGGTFEGVATSTLNVAGIQVSIKTDQNCTVYIDQSPDGSNWDITDHFHYYTSFGGEGWTVQAIASYVRVRVTNANATTGTTYFRLQTALCPFVEAIPRSLTDLGNLKTSVEELKGYLGIPVEVTPMNQLKVTETFRLVGPSLDGGTFDTNFWTKTSQVGTGDATLSGGQMTLATGITANSSIIVNSVRVGRYVPASPNYYRGTVRAPAVTGTNIRRWGAFDANNGYFLEHNGTTLSLVCRKTASDANKVNSGSFNGIAGSTYLLDTNCHIYEIYWTNDAAYFVIDEMLIHTFAGATAVLTDSLTLKVGMQCTNAGGNINNNTLEVRAATINRLGKEQTAPMWKNIHGILGATVLKYGAGKLQKVIVNYMPNGGSTALYDALTATNPIAICAPATNFSGTLEYDLDFYTGLTVVTANGNTDVTIVYE